MRKYANENIEKLQSEKKKRDDEAIAVVFENIFFAPEAYNGGPVSPLLGFLQYL